MKFKTNNLKRKASLAARGFLVIVILLIFISGITLIYITNLIDNDHFLSLAPSETIFYWHSNEGEKEEIKNLLFGLVCQLFNLTDFLFLDKSIQEAKEVSLAVLPQGEAILFLKTETNKNFKNKLEEANLNYILEKENIIITNSRNALLKLINVRSKKNLSLSSKLNVKLNLKILSLKHPSQIYFRQPTFQSTTEKKLFDILPLKSKVMISLKYKNENGLVWWEKYNFILTSSLIPNFEKIENFVKEQLAFRLPILQTKILPDKTEVKEIIADSSLFQFQKITVQGYEINHIFEPRLNFEFAYSNVNSIFFASNSKSLLENYLENQKKGKNIIKKLVENIFLNKQVKYLGIKYVDKLLTIY